VSLILWIEKVRKERWERGREQYRAHPDAPFNGDGKMARDHMLEEVADALNYNEQSARDREITGWAAGEIDVHLREVVRILEADSKRSAAL